MSASDRAASLNVALLTPCFWPEVRRGGERFVHDLAAGLAARGHRPRVVTSHRGAPSRAAEDGYEVIRHWRPPAGRLVRRGFEDHLTHVPLSYLSLLRGGDDVVQAVYATDALAAARLTRRRGTPSVFSVLGAPDRLWLVRRRHRARITAEAVRGCSVVTALSEAAAAALRRSLGVEAHVISPGVDTTVFTPGAGRSEEPLVFCPSAAGDQMKRVPLLLEAMALVRRERPGARLALDRPRDEGLAARLEGGGAELHGPLASSEDLASLYRQAWVTALPSVGEAFGLVLAESLACGTPGVGARAGGIPEVLDRPEVGVLFDGDEPAPLAAAIMEGLELARVETTAAACRARAEELSVERTVDAHESLYRELLEAA